MLLYHKRVNSLFIELLCGQSLPWSVGEEKVVGGMGHHGEWSCFGALKEFRLAQGCLV